MKLFLVCFLFINVLVVLSCAKKTSKPSKVSKSKERGSRETTTLAESTTTTTTTTESTTTTTTTTTTTVAPGPNTAVCNATTPVYSYTYTYMKTACYINTPMTTADANAFCQANGMKFYEITGVEVLRGFENLINTVYPDTPDVAFIGNGIMDSSGTWNLYSDQSIPLYTGLIWGTPRTTSPTPCYLHQRLGVKYIDYYSYAIDCSTVGEFECEFVGTPPTFPPDV